MDDDATDPDVVAAHPPETAVDPKLYFQVGENEGKWLEYDDRGVPTKNIKKRKPTKKEKDSLEAEFLEAKTRYQQYLKDVEVWQKQLVELEAALEGRDKLRWAFRQVGEEKAAPIAVDELEDLFRIAGWDDLSRREIGCVKKTAAEFTDESDRLDLEALRKFTTLQMPVLLLEERLQGDVMDEFGLEELYSPRTWRRKLADCDDIEGLRKEKKDKKSKKDSKGGKSSPRGPSSPRGGPSSPRGGGATSARKKSSKDGDASPRVNRETTQDGAASPRGGRERKEKKENKSK